MKLFVIVFISLLSFGSCVSAPKNEKAARGSAACLVDPLLVSPNIYRLVSESEEVREIRLLANPGDRDRLHGHYQGEWTVLQGGKGRLHDAEGGFRDVTLKKGMSGTQKRTMLHAFENIGESVIEVKMVETKAKDIAWCAGN